MSLTSSIYIPLGFTLAPIILPAKKLLQDLYKQRLDCNGAVGEKESRRWEHWKVDLPKLLNNVSLKEVRQTCRPRKGKVRRNTSFRWRLTVRILCPVLRISSQWLCQDELSAAILAVQLDETIKFELEIPLHQAVFWTDSTTGLQYINSPQSAVHIL